MIGTLEYMSEDHPCTGKILGYPESGYVMGSILLAHAKLASFTAGRSILFHGLDLVSWTAVA